MAPADVVALRPYLRLARVPTAGFTASIVLWGYFAARHDAGLPLSGVLLTPQVLGLLCIGVLAHVFGSVHNEICDRQIDARATYVSAKPLVSGQVSVASARRLAGAAIFGALALAAAVASTTDPSVFALMGLAALCAAAYNRYGKRFLGGELLFSGSLTIFFFTGASAVAGSESVVAGGVLAFAVLAFLALSFQVIFVGGVKDIRSDEASGLRTVAVRLVRREESGDGDQSDEVELRFVVSAGTALLSVFLLAAIYLLRWVTPPGGSNELVLLQLGALFATSVARILVFLLAMAAQERRRRLALLAINEALQLPLFVALLLPSITAEALLLLVFIPVAVALALNRAVFGMIAAPDV